MNRRDFLKLLGMAGAIPAAWGIADQVREAAVMPDGLALDPGDAIQDPAPIPGEIVAENVRAWSAEYREERIDVSLLGDGAKNYMPGPLDVDVYVEQFGRSSFHDLAVGDTADVLLPSMREGSEGVRFNGVLMSKSLSLDLDSAPVLNTTWRVIGDVEFFRRGA